MAGSIEVLTFPATLDGFNAEFETLRSWLDQERVPPKPHYDAELVYEEVVTNIIRYGYDDPTGQSVEVKLERLPDGLMMTFTDSGMAFDPLQSVDPAVPKSIDEAKKAVSLDTNDPICGSEDRQGSAGRHHHLHL